MIPTFLLDSIMICLLLFAVAFCWRLNHRLTSLKSMGLTLTPALQSFNRLVEKLNEAIHQIKTQTLSTKQLLDKDIPKAVSIKEDLELLLEYCETASNRLETLMEQARSSECDLSEVLEKIQLSIPKTFRQTLDQSDIKVDFEELQNKNIQELKMIPQALYPRTTHEGIYIDYKLQEAFGDLR